MASTEFPIEVMSDVDGDEIFSNESERESEDEECLCIRIQHIVILLGVHLTFLANTLEIFIPDKKWSYTASDHDKDYDLTSDFSKEDDQLPDRTSETTHGARQFACDIEDMKDDLYLLSSDVHLYISKYQSAVSSEYPEKTDEFRRRIERDDGLRKKDIKERVVYHITQIAKCVMHLSEDVKRIVAVCRELPEKGNKKKGIKRDVSSRRQDMKVSQAENLQERCNSFKEDWTVYSERMNKYATHLPDKVQQTEASRQCSDKGGLVWQWNPFHLERTYSGQEKTGTTEANPSERDEKHVRDDHIAADVKMKLQLYYRFKVFQNQLATLNAVFCEYVFSKDLKQSTQLSPHVKKKNDEEHEHITSNQMYIVRMIFCTKFRLYWLFSFLRMDISGLFPENLERFEKHWKQQREEHRKKFSDWKMKCVTTEIEYNVRHIEKHANMFAEDLAKRDVYPRGYQESEPLPGLKRLLRQIKTFSKMVKGENLRENRRDFKAYFKEVTKRKDQENAVDRALRDLMSRHPTRQFKVCLSCSPPGKYVIIGYDDLLPQNRAEKQTINEVEVIMKNPYQVDDEATLLHNHNLKEKRLRSDGKILEIMRECIKANANNLWRKHSNLTIISGDHVKLKNKKPSLEPCIVLCCLSKGFVPVDEPMFPKQLTCHLGTIETDVREGFFTLGTTDRYGLLDSYNDPLCMGSNIGRRVRNESGSLGLFVNLPDNDIGFITCCHVLFNCIRPEHFLYRKSPPDDKHVIQPGNASMCGREDRECGVIEWAVFDPCFAAISIDAALVKVTERQPNSGHFVIKDLTQAKELGYTKTALPAFETGEIRRNIGVDDFDKQLLKSGTSTGLTRSLFRMDGAQVRVFHNGAWLGSKDQKIIVMKGQIEVEGGIINKPFFIPGDSGSAVFIKELNGQLACIGIAIGATSYGTAVITPIAAVLDALDLRDSDVKKFS